MKAADLKNILEIPFSIGKSFAPITEYLYFNEDTVKATNLESYLEIVLNGELPFNGCVLTEPLKKFLNSVNKEVDLRFDVNTNVLTINYGKKNKFNIPMESLDSFPESPTTKYAENTLVNSLLVTNGLIENFERSIKCTSDTDILFNGVYLEGSKIYSSNREIVYSGNLDARVNSFAFIPKDLVKYIIKFKETFEKIEIYGQGFKVYGGNTVLYFPNFDVTEMPKFNSLLDSYENLLIIKNTEELKECVNRVKQFDEIVNISIKGNSINIFTNNIDESVEIENSIDKEYSFKFNILYLKMLTDTSDFLDLMTKKGGTNQPLAFGGTTDKYRIIAATVI